MAKNLIKKLKPQISATTIVRAAPRLILKNCQSDKVDIKVTKLADACENQTVLTDLFHINYYSS